MKKNQIKLTDALTIMDQSLNPDGSYNSFNIEFVRFSATNKTADNGKIVKLENVVRTGLPGHVKSSMRKGLRVLKTNQIKSCYIWLIIKFNGKDVIW